jgi:hypothetical protein
MDTELILKEWCKQIPRGFPTIQNGQFTNQAELDILKNLLQEKTSSTIIVKENFAEYCYSKLGKSPLIDDIINDISNDQNLFESILNIINEENLDSTLSFINNNKNNKTLARLLDAKISQAAGISNMGRGEIPLIILHKTAIKGRGDGDVEIGGQIYEVKESLPLRAGTKTQPSIVELSRVILNLNSYFSTIAKNTEISDYISSHNGFKQLANRYGWEGKTITEIWMKIIEIKKTKKELKEPAIVDDKDEDEWNRNHKPTTFDANLSSLNQTKLSNIMKFINLIKDFSKLVQSNRSDLENQNKFHIKNPSKTDTKVFKINKDDDVRAINTIKVGQDTNIDVQRVSSSKDHDKIKTIAYIIKDIPENFSMENLNDQIIREFVRPYTGGIIWIDKGGKVGNKGNYYHFTRDQFVKDWKFDSISQAIRPQFKPNI